MQNSNRHANANGNKRTAGVILAPVNNVTIRSGITDINILIEHDTTLVTG